MFPDASPLVAGVILLRLAARMESTTCESGHQSALAPVEAYASSLASPGHLFSLAIDS